MFKNHDDRAANMATDAFDFFFFEKTQKSCVSMHW
jgi:hypothetical protein